MVAIFIMCLLATFGVISIFIAVESKGFGDGFAGVLGGVILWATFLAILITFGEIRQNAKKYNGQEVVAVVETNDKYSVCFFDGHILTFYKDDDKVLWSKEGDTMTLEFNEFSGFGYQRIVLPEERLVIKEEKREYAASEGSDISGSSR